ncbi:MAG TPA: hypothetical protein VN192_04455 [Flavobacterium sp.]|jgi:DNA-3-methyladenine glycosylase II|nr:hypothetical protein [Flavobacterium sp.]
MQKAISYLINKEIIFDIIVNSIGLPKIPSRPKGFETLVLLILEQQVSIESAKATFLKIKANVSCFEPKSMLSLSDEDYRALGVSRQKSKYIKELAKALYEQHLDLETLHSKSSQQIREELIKIKGIGNWTIDIYLMFCMKEQDIIPLGDIAIINTIKELFNIHTKAEMEILTQKWMPFRSMATFLLWHYYLEKRGRKISY